MPVFVLHIKTEYKDDIYKGKCNNYLLKLEVSQSAGSHVFSL